MGGNQKALTSRATRKALFEPCTTNDASQIEGGMDVRQRETAFRSAIINDSET